MKFFYTLVLTITLSSCASKPTTENDARCENYAKEADYEAGESCLQYIRRTVGPYNTGADRPAKIKSR